MAIVTTCGCGYRRDALVERLAVVEQELTDMEQMTFPMQAQTLAGWRKRVSTLKGHLAEQPRQMDTATGRFLEVAA